MAAAAAPLSSSSSDGIVNSPSLPPHRLHHFTPIHEGNESEEDGSERDHQTSSAAPTPPTHLHQPTPLHPSSSSSRSTPSSRTRKRRVLPETSTSISCNNCRPTTTRGTDYNKTTSLVVPVLDGGGGSSSNNNNRPTITIPSPNVILKSILSTLALRSPKQPRSSTESSSDQTPTPSPVSAVKRREERWKLAAAELSQKLVQANRKRDDAIREAGEVKRSMEQLERKLNKLEVYCHSLKSGLEGFNSSSSSAAGVGGANNDHHNNNNNNHKPNQIRAALSPVSHFATTDTSHDQIIENFLTSVSESRSAVRHLSRAMTAQIRQTGIGISSSSSSSTSTTELKLTFSAKNPRSTILYLESQLNTTLYTDFESPNFARTGTTRILNPLDRCESNYTAFNLLRELTWEEVLAKGTKHFSEEFSGYCDRKMSEVVGLLGLKNYAWPEPLLQAFFGACKGVWLVHLLANSVRDPGGLVAVFRVDKGVGFDSDYMEDLGREKVAGSGLVPSLVKVMVAPGFYVGDSVVKCKVLCRYVSGNGHRGSLDGGGDERRVVLLGCEKKNSSTP